MAEHFKFLAKSVDDCVICTGQPLLSVDILDQHFFSCSDRLSFDSESLFGIRMFKDPHIFKTVLIHYQDFLFLADFSLSIILEWPSIDEHFILLGEHVIS